MTAQIPNCEFVRKKRKAIFRVWKGITAEEDDLPLQRSGMFHDSMVHAVVSGVGCETCCWRDPAEGFFWCRVYKSTEGVSECIDDSEILYTLLRVWEWSLGARGEGRSSIE